TLERERETSANSYNLPLIVEISSRTNWSNRAKISMRQSSGRFLIVDEALFSSIRKESYASLGVEPARFQMEVETVRLTNVEHRCENIEWICR
ncbi:hypothetical protein PMAYCL1PPCAC_25306, partial [Pristionchus mayeri]